MSVTAQPAITAIGRRKTATARVRLTPGSGKLIVNGQDLHKRLAHESFVKIALAPLETIEQQDAFDATILVSGGGQSGQAGAISLGLARALEKHNAEWRSPLKKAGLMKRDPREKERKKSGQPGARKRFQFSKR